MKNTFPVIRLAILSFFKKENLHVLLLMILFAAWYAYLGRQIAIQLNTAAKPLPFEQARLLLYLFLSVPFIASFLPVYIAKKKWVPGYFPVSKNTWAFIDLLSSFVNSGAIGGFALLLSFMVSYQFSNLSFNISIGLLFVTGNLAANVLINLLSWRKYYGWIPALVAVVAGVIVFLESDRAGFESLVFVNGIAIVLLVLLSFVTFSLAPVQSLRVVFLAGHIVKSKVFILLKEAIHSGQAITPLLIALIIKAAGLFFFPVREVAGVSFASVNTFHFFFFTPIFIFLNVFNNAFGFFPGIYSIAYSYNLSYKSLLSIYVRLIAPFVLADMLIALTFYFSYTSMGAPMLLFYASTLPYYIGVGFGASLMFGKKIAPFSWGSLKGNTHTAGNLAIVLPVFIGLFYAANIPAAYIAYATLLLSIVLYIIVLPRLFLQFGYTFVQRIKD